MKGTITEEEREQLMAEANEDAEAKAGHYWWVQTTSPQRKRMLRWEIHRALNN